MNADLEATARNEGEGYVELAARFMSAPGVAPSRDYGAPVFRRRRRAVRWAAAASLLAAAVPAVVLVSASGGDRAEIACRGEYSLAYRGGDASALEEIVRSQRPDGSWGSDFLTRQNAAAIAGFGGGAVAYRRAVRYLRSKGLSPFTPDEMRRNAEPAARMVKWQTQRT